jgi:hypothetical protein
MEVRMFDQPGGWLWLVIDVLGVIVLGVALLYASRKWLQRRNDGETERATRRLYESEERAEEENTKRTGQPAGGPYRRPPRREPDSGTKSRTRAF